MRVAMYGCQTSNRRDIMRSSVSTAFGAILAISAALAPAMVQAQGQLDVHGNYSMGTSTHNKSWGGGVGVQTTFGKTSPIAISTSPGFDYLKQENGGPSQTSVSLDVNVQPGGNSSITPYVGGSASANWSGGSGKMWDGAKLGLETMGGAQFKLTSSASIKAEERFGFVKTQEHTLTTRVGFLVSF
jgi:opacity protein-like surface antigen